MNEWEWQLLEDKPSLESVLEEQLGLRLVAGKKSLPVYVVESVERPTGN